MTDETKAPPILEPQPDPDEIADEPETAPEPEPEADEIEATPPVDQTAGVWRCLNEQCPDAKAGATFLGSSQQDAQVSGVHPVCPACQNDPAPHYIFVADAAKKTEAATAA